jgi:hypothetical protein
MSMVSVNMYDEASNYDLTLASASDFIVSDACDCGTVAKFINGMSLSHVSFFNDCTESSGE